MLKASILFHHQIQSNALGALEAIDPIVADRIMQEGCITGDRINGLCDGVTGDWSVQSGLPWMCDANMMPGLCFENACLNDLMLRRYVKFDTFHPAVDAGLPVTRVISRVSLQNVLAKVINYVCITYALIYAATC